MAVQMYKQRYFRENSKHTDNTCPDTPRTKTKKLLRNFSQKDVRKTLTYYYAMEGQVKTAYLNLKGNSEKKEFGCSFAGFTFEEV